MTDPKEVIRQFLDLCRKRDKERGTRNVEGWSVDDVRKSLQDQMAARRHSIMSNEVKRSQEAVQGLSDRLEALTEISEVRVCGFTGRQRPTRYFRTFLVRCC